MNLAEMMKRFIEISQIYGSMYHYRHIDQWPYRRFSDENSVTLKFQHLPHYKLNESIKEWKFYNQTFNLKNEINWFFSETKQDWPNIHFQKIDYRPGNPYGDIRINWELNRLQFLPTMALHDQNLTEAILKDWLNKNRFLHGPGYVASMEVAIRWCSVYWAVCNLKSLSDTELLKDIAGLGYVSGKYIESRLSTHSSAGNHLIVEAVGLFWIGTALEGCKHSQRWIRMSRRILCEQILRQINEDGTNREQSFWYLGFIMDAIAHYLLLEKVSKLPKNVCQRLVKAMEFIDFMTLDDGGYPDYGDRDDGHIFRISPDYQESPFPGLLNTYAYLMNRPDWVRTNKYALQRLRFWTSGDKENYGVGLQRVRVCKDETQAKTYPDGGLTVIDRNKIRLIFDHGLLGMDDTCGHGHADALSFILFWGNTCILLDPGSGQYNGSQGIRNYFRSTLAHNTIQIQDKDQAEISGPFLWNKPYNTKLIQLKTMPNVYLKASHDGYQERYGTTHEREIIWHNGYQFTIKDEIIAADSVNIKGAFQITDQVGVTIDQTTIFIDHDDFHMTLDFETDVKLMLFNGKDNPFRGWKSNIYGSWTPIYTVVYEFEECKKLSSCIRFSYHEK